MCNAFEAATLNRWRPAILVLLLTILAPAQVRSQAIETVGTRALGMGGAFVAAADDSTASWWNPAGLAAGPFLGLSVGWGSADSPGDAPTAHSGWVAVGTPPFGLSYYQTRSMKPTEATAAPEPGREEGRTSPSAASHVVRQFGATVVQTLADGIHAGMTLKYLRGGRSGAELFQEMAASAFDLDVGLLAVRGPVRVGGTVRNLRRADVGGFRVDRQFRAGAAFDAREVGGVPLLVAVDADLGTYETWHGDRRVVAIGAEAWSRRRVSVRAGARFNVAGREEKSFATGGTVTVRSGVHLDGHVVVGGADSERGWGMSLRASF